MPLKKTIDKVALRRLVVLWGVYPDEKQPSELLILAYRLLGSNSCLKKVIFPPPPQKQPSFDSRRCNPGSLHQLVKVQLKSVSKLFELNLPRSWTLNISYGLVNSIFDLSYYYCSCSQKLSYFSFFIIYSYVLTVYSFIWYFLLIYSFE